MNGEILYVWSAVRGLWSSAKGATWSSAKGATLVCRKWSFLAFVEKYLLLHVPQSRKNDSLYIGGSEKEKQKEKESITHRTLQFPVTVGYNILQKSKTNVFVTAGAVPRLDLNTQYKLNNFESVHAGSWQGISANAGGGMEYTLNRHLAISGSLTYAVWNEVPRDNKVRDEFQQGVIVSYNYLELSAGVKWGL